MEKVKLTLHFMNNMVRSQSHLTHQNKNTTDVFDRMLEIGNRAAAGEGVSSVLELTIDYVIEISGAEHGMISLFDDHGQPPFRKIRNLHKQDIDESQFEMSMRIIEKVKVEGKSICLPDMFEDTKTKGSNDIPKTFSIMCFPLKRQDELFGVIYLDNRSYDGVFKQDTFRLVETFCDFVSLAAFCALEKKRLAKQIDSLELDLRRKYQFGSIVGHHPKMVDVLKLISQVADTDATVLIQGESGTGKELVAKALHDNSSRRDQPLVVVNCGALTETLLESELFGHIRGAFTGALQDKRGWFERADGGTIFLDEAQQMPLTLQIKVLRILQTGEFSRVGSAELEYCDMRVIVATSKDLQTLVSNGKFREELYYRLNVIDLELPPLRERRSDIPLLTQHFLNVFNKKYGRDNLYLNKQAEALLFGFDFPGNVRELENIIHRAVILSENETIEPKVFPSCVSKDGAETSQQVGPSTFMVAKKRLVEKFERDFIAECLKAAKGNITRAAHCAGINIKNFHVKMNKYSIDPHSYK